MHSSSHGSLDLRRLAPVLLGLLLMLTSVGSGMQLPEKGVAIQMPASHIAIRTVRSNWGSDYDVINRRQGSVTYSDCVTFANDGPVAATHIQFIFAAVNDLGEIEGQALPLDLHFRIDPGAVHASENCRVDGYGNGENGFRLIAWVNLVDFADGTSWHSDGASQLKARILDALLKARS